MKVAYIYLGSKGATYDALGMAVGLSHYSDVLCIISRHVDNLKLWEREAKENPKFRLLEVNVGNTIISGITGLFNIARFIKIINEIDSFSPDFVYSFMGHPWEKMFVPYLNCKNTFQSRHDAEADHGDKDWRRAFFNLFNYKSKYIVTYSQCSKNGLVKQGYDADKIAVTHLACNLFSNQENKQLDLIRHNKFLFWGRIEPYKGMGVLLQSVKSVFDECPTAKLIIAGRGDLTQYEDFLVRYKDNIEVHNEWIPNEKIGDFFNSVDFVVVPYIAASQSGVVTLAYSYGKPVIASDSGALPEQVANGKTGLVVPAGDSSKLADAISYLLDNDKELSVMKKNAFEYSKELTWNAAAKMIIDFLTEKGELEQS